MVGVNIDITERKRAEEHQRVLMAELDHRVKNVLATVSAIISRTQGGSLLAADFATALDGRIRSMSSTHELELRPAGAAYSCWSWSNANWRHSSPATMQISKVQTPC